VGEPKDFLYTYVVHNVEYVVSFDSKTIEVKEESIDACDVEKRILNLPPRRPGKILSGEIIARARE
jgi:hypothetical protein